MHAVTAAPPPPAPAVLRGAHVVARLTGKLTPWSPAERAEGDETIRAVLRDAPPSAVRHAPSLALGVLTMPVPARAPHVRTYHRAAHRPQRAVVSGRVVLRYLVTEDEVRRAKASTRVALTDEQRTFGDLLELPSVPAGWRLLEAPPGANCVLKILSWLQHAVRRYPKTTFVAYGDDDTFWALGRVEATVSMLRRLGAESLPIYAGAMQYHAWWDFEKQEPHDWMWTFPAASKAFSHQHGQFLKSMRALGANRSNAYVEAREHVERLSHPYAMAHGLGVLLSRSLCLEVLNHEDIHSFFQLYLRSSSSLSRSQLGNSKCRLGTDSTFGFWVSFLPQVLAVDLINFHGAWPWPLPNRCHGQDARYELRGVHAFHLFGNEATDAHWWLYLLNMTDDEDPPLQPRTRLNCLEGYSNKTRSLVESWVANGVALPRKSSGWMKYALKGQGHGMGRYLNWVFCDISCPNPCSIHGWAELGRQ
ncbi:hypothetical protein AB1Y20_007496 [Prymnesium parvum]|uniref:Hexosyltransferase n=1 Tax=Prymnesium parvum TaxID=97485 RepID=A0AB34IY01_PRYPA